MTTAIKLPRTLAAECRDFACPDAWASLVVREFDSGQNVEVWLEDNVAVSRLFHAVASAVSIARDRDTSKADARRWTKSLRANMENLQRLHRIDLSAALDMLV